MSTASKFPWWNLRMRTTSHHITWMLGRRFPEVFPYVFVLGHPKSGTTWGCQLLADVMQLPFPRFSLLPVGCEAVVHGHELVDAKYPRGVYMVRDGRDVLVSRTFFALRHLAEGPNPRLSAHQRRVFGEIKSKDDPDNFRRLLEYTLSKGSPKIGNWSAHVRSFLNTPHHHFQLLRYEDLLDDGVSTLTRVVRGLTGKEPDPELAEMAVRKYDFARQRKARDTVAEGGKKFLRKGRAGDWRNHFTPELARLFDHHMGDDLIAMGYEKDHSWVDGVGEPEPQAASA